MFDDVLENVGEPFKGGKGFEWGTHEVTIGTVNATQKKTKANPDAAVIEVEVFDETDDTKTGTATLYFHTEGGAKMSVAKILGIMVHNVGEEKKDKVRELGKKLFADIDDPTKARDIAAKLMTDKMVGKKAFFVVEPQGKYKTSSYGDIWHYPAEPQSKPVEAVAVTGGEDITGTEEAEAIPDFGDDL
jgi:hypothetical protein